MHNTEYLGPESSISKEIDEMKYRQKDESFDEKKQKIIRGHDLAPGVIKIVKDLDIQASKLKKRGRINRMNKILKRRTFIEKQIKLTKVPEVYIST